MDSLDQMMAIGNHLGRTPEMSAIETADLLNLHTEDKSNNGAFDPFNGLGIVFEMISIHFCIYFKSSLEIPFTFIWAHYEILEGFFRRFYGLFADESTELVLEIYIESVPIDITII